MRCNGTLWRSRPCLLQDGEGGRRAGKSVQDEQVVEGGRQSPRTMGARKSAGENGAGQRDVKGSGKLLAEAEVRGGKMMLVSVARDEGAAPVLERGRPVGGRRVQAAREREERGWRRCQRAGALREDGEDLGVRGEIQGAQKIACNARVEALPIIGARSSSSVKHAEHLPVEDRGCEALAPCSFCFVQAVEEEHHHRQGPPGEGEKPPSQKKEVAPRRGTSQQERCVV